MRSIASIAPIILAAGDSSRMGYPKALLPLGPDLFVTRILKTLRNVGLPKPVIILGKTASIVQPQIGDWPADIFVNPDPNRGQLSSIQLALSCLHAEFIAGLVWPVDQPAVSEDLIRRLAQLFVTSESRIAYPMYGDKRGHPAIFHRALFQEFMGAAFEEGPKQILERHRGTTAVLPTSEIASVQDIDTPADYLDLTGESLGSALAKVKVRGIAQS
jgi:molybdenum cofactor cytidylyltransferase